MDREYDKRALLITRLEMDQASETMALRPSERRWCPKIAARQERIEIRRAEFVIQEAGAEDVLAEVDVRVNDEVVLVEIRRRNGRQMPTGMAVPLQR